MAILSVLAISLCCVLAACQSEKDLTLSGYDKDGLELIEYDKAYAPFWEGTTVYNESCVFIKGEDGKITLKTMFTPTKVIAVRDSTLEITYKEGTDYTYRDGVFTLTENSSIPYFTYNQAHYNVGKGVTTLTDEERADLTGIDIQTGRRWKGSIRNGRAKNFPKRLRNWKIKSRSRSRFTATASLP